MLTQNLIWAAIMTIILYQLNLNQGWYFVTNVQYALIFIAVALTLEALEKFQGFTTQKAMTQFMQQMNLTDNTKLEETVANKNGQHVTACYHTPFKVIRTQYGDRGLLAGYNEHVEAYQQGGINQQGIRHQIYLECMEDADAIDVSEEVIKK